MPRHILANAFQPATEVEDPLRFAGREGQVKDLAESLHVDGSVPLLYGQRGLGKSSLSLQTSRIAQGDIELLSQFGLEHLHLEEHRRFITFLVTCTDTVASLADLLQLLVNAVESLEFDASGQTRSAGRLVDRTTRRKLALKVVEFESTTRYAQEAGRVNYQDLNLEEKLVQLCELITRYYGQPVMFVIDELDRVKNSDGFAAFLKAASSQTLKFVLVGIAANHSELLADHQSLSRRLVPVLVTPMDESELEDIVTRVEDHLIAHNEFFAFASSAKNRLARIASGYPWFVHVIGQSALLRAADAGRHEVELKDVQKALDGLISDRFAQQYSDRYQVAVRGSIARERVLRLFASWSDSDIPTSEIYPLAQQIGVTNPSVYRGHLTSEQYGEVLYAPVFQQRALLRFKDEMFKIYIQLRPSIFIGVSEEVDARVGRR